MKPENILLIHCAEGAKKAIRRMTELGCRIPGNVMLFELPCTGRVNEVLLMETLEKGFSGIIVLGCHRDNCRYLTGNLRAEKRINRVRTLLKDAGIRDKWIKMIFISPDEGLKLSREIEGFINNTKEQGVTNVS
jgi:coenzyme F420-reducing hydrogenase delta subunit